jgi:ATP-dependent DNA helicase RecG
MSLLYSSVDQLKGIGDKKKKLLKKINIETLEDMATYLPREYIDRRKKNKIIEVIDGQNANFEVEVIRLPEIRRPRRKMSIMKLAVKDDSGVMFLTWFNQDYLKSKFEIGDKLRVSGKVKRAYGRVELQQVVFEHCDEEERNTGKIVPRYRLTKGIKNTDMINWNQTIFERYSLEFQSIIPKNIRDKYKLTSYPNALKELHFPRGRDEYKLARKTLIFEELFGIEMGLKIIKNQNRKLGIRFKDSVDMDVYKKALGFELTDAQNRVWDEIKTDMESSYTMNRLVQGDVGSGKTAIAFLAIVKAILNGYQVAMMAPTEILARQHYEKMQKYLGDSYQVGLLVGSMTSKEKRNLNEKLLDGDIKIVIGTHALLEDYVKFSNLGLVITDEQHRFGVRQRAMLSSKAGDIDVLVMTATPIPRTLTLVLYGDLELSVIDELPPGRQKIKTYTINSKKRKDAYGFIEKEIELGRQAYIVCPLVEESEVIEAQSASEIYNDVKRYFVGRNIGLLHGKMKKDEKNHIMSEFSNGNIDLIVSTTVIEVGVDVPNATIMMIENAERFGLAQLHQLRGRIGRGKHKSYCILVNGSESEESAKRMQIMVDSSNGFEIAEKDLEIRGPGQIIGTRQHGLPEFKIANLCRDQKIMKCVKDEVENLLDGKVELNKDEESIILKKVKHMFGENCSKIILN